MVTVLCLVTLTANSAYSSIAPFYPAEALAKGVPQASFGFIFAGYSVSMFVFAPLFSRMLTIYGRKKVLITGCVCESLAMICFGLFIYIEDPVWYAVLSFICRFVEGFGNGCLNSSTNAIIAFNYEDEASKLIGLTQTFTGLGMLSGPIIGSVLFELGGFKLPFFVVGAALFLLIVPISLYVVDDKAQDRPAQISNLIRHQESPEIANQDSRREDQIR